MIKGGVGGANTNKTGLAFEKKTSLADALIAADFRVEDFKVYDAQKLRGELAPKFQLYKFLEAREIYWQDRLSGRLLPDDTFFNLESNKLHIVEKKWQEVSGSVDEKLATVGFKIRQYNKLVDGSGIEVKFIYLLNDWFTQPSYADVLQYIVDCGASYHFNSVPLSELEL